MLYILSGLLLFFGVHLLPGSNLRPWLIERLGEIPYKALFALLSLCGIVLLVMGMGNRSYITVWHPPAWGVTVPLVLMLPACVLVVGAYLPGNIKRLTRHPMLWGVTLWAVSHLMANGDLESMLLFFSFLVYSLYDMWSANRRGALKATARRPVLYDLLVSGGGVALYLALLYLHPYFAGVAVG